MTTRRFLLRAALIAFAAALPLATPAQKQAIRLIVPYAAGGPVDTTARLLAEQVREALGPVIVDNKPGAGGNIGAAIVAKAAPDGHIIGIAATATNAVNPWLYADMPFNAVTNIRAGKFKALAVTTLARSPMLPSALRLASHPEKGSARAI
jgi:tripartite-type tricarboxylate transporter receptor subunit TctC